MADETKRIIIRKGLASETPTLQEGEPGFQTDTKELLLGTNTGNISFAKTGHTHVVGDVTNLQSTLDGKAEAAHNHTISHITALQTALDGKSNTGHVHAIADVTGLQTALDGKTTTTYVDSAINNLIASAPGTLDTLNELAAALGDDPNFAATVTATLNLLSITQDINHYRVSCEQNSFNPNDNSRMLYYIGKSITINSVNYIGNVFQRTISFNQYEDFTIALNGAFDYVYNQASITKVVVNTTIFQPAGTDNFETSEAGNHRLTLITQGSDPTTASSTRTLIIEKV